jgi:Flp pilus assembly protein TadD
MTKKFCRQCGSALTKAGAKFCTTCGATVDGAETDDVTSQETVGLPGEQTVQTVAATEVLPASKPPSNYNTEEMPQVGITGRAEGRATAVVADAPITQSQAKPAGPAPANRLSNGRKKLGIAVALCVVALAAASFFFINSRRPPEAQVGNQTAAQAEPARSTQPVAQQSNQQPNQQLGQQPGANDQAQPQTKPQPTGEVKSSAIHNAEAASNQQRQGAAKPMPATPQEQQAAGGPTSAEQSLNQGKTFYNERRYQEALGEFERVKKLDPANKDVYYLIGLSYQEMNQLGQALEAYRQCTSGQYASVAQGHVKTLEKKVGKVNAK